MKSKETAKNATSNGHPHGNAADFEAMLRASMDELVIKTNSHREQWGLGEEQQWCLDEGSGEVVFTFDDAVVSASAQVVGTYDTATHVWTWAWGDTALPDHLKAESWHVREYGTQQGFQHLVTPSWTAEESHCWYMTALSARLSSAEGAFRGVSGDKLLFLTFGQPTVAPVNEPAPQFSFEPLMTEAAEEFKNCVENPDAQRQVCVRYLSRGALAGLAQDELIHRLGLAAPSVLDLAGYSSDQAESVMGMLKGITDEEISSAQ